MTSVTWLFVQVTPYQVHSVPAAPFQFVCVVQFWPPVLLYSATSVALSVLVGPGLGVGDGDGLGAGLGLGAGAGLGAGDGFAEGPDPALPPPHAVASMIVVEHSRPQNIRTDLFMNFLAADGLGEEAAPTRMTRERCSQYRRSDNDRT